MAMAMTMVMTSSKLVCVMVIWGVLLVNASRVQDTQAECAGEDLTKLYSCLSASTADVMPSAACCQVLGGFATDSGAACLCAASSDPRFTSSGAKVQYAILIPKKCNLKFKAGYVCKGVVIPGGQ